LEGESADIGRPMAGRGLPMKRLTDLLRRAKRIFQTEGLVPLFRQALAFVAWRFFEYETLYLFEHSTDNVRSLDEADFMPKIEDFTFKIISTNREADELESEGLEFRLYVLNARERLDKGAVAFCVFVGRELAHMGWAAMTEEAKASMAEPPNKVDFAGGEVCTGGTRTNPKYRGMGLAAYVYLKRFQFLRERNKLIARACANTNNIASHRMHAKFGPKRYAEARYLKILWWKFWKEKPLP